MSTGSKVIAQTDRQTHTHRHDENITSTAYAGGNDYIVFKIVDKPTNFKKK